MKLWRREAQVINAEAGLKHQGRRYKSTVISMGKMPSGLLVALFKRVGLANSNI